ncbi:MAG TPA: hypothetical protein DCQ06_13610 [Myxococcales bacterium]|nr:hypothetical protein [Myxococcales bacterium]HAN32627.1 hypothetical protein [Myxococcales bacterium]
MIGLRRSGFVTACMVALAGCVSPLPSMMQATEQSNPLGAHSWVAWAVFIALGLVTIYGVDLATHVVWRVGFDAGRRLHIVRRWLRLIVALAWMGLGIEDLIALQPALSPVLAVVLGSLALVALARPVQNLFAGLMILLQGRIQAGDHVEIRDVEGSIDSVGLLQLRVRDAGGQTLLVPNRLFNEAIVTVSRSTKLVPALGRVPLQGVPDPSTLDRARSMTLLSPWRVSGTPVRVWVDGGCLAAEMQTWGSEAVDPARVALESLLSESIEAQSDD